MRNNFRRSVGWRHISSVATEHFERGPPRLTYQRWSLAHGRNTPFHLEPSILYTNVYTQLGISPSNKEWPSWDPCFRGVVVGRCFGWSEEDSFQWLAGGRCCSSLCIVLYWLQQTVWGGTTPHHSNTRHSFHVKARWIVQWWWWWWWWCWGLTQFKLSNCRCYILVFWGGGLIHMSLF